MKKKVLLAIVMVSLMMSLMPTFQSAEAGIWGWVSTGPEGGADGEKIRMILNDTANEIGGVPYEYSGKKVPGASGELPGFAFYNDFTLWREWESCRGLCSDAETFMPDSIGISPFESEEHAMAYFEAEYLSHKNLTAFERKWYECRAAEGESISPSCEKTQFNGYPAYYSEIVVKSEERPTTECGILYTTYFAFTLEWLCGRYVFHVSRNTISVGFPISSDPVRDWADVLFRNAQKHGLCVEKEIDSDKDGVPDDKDKCPGTPTGVAVDERGCPTIPDSDGDGVPDDVPDECPGTPAGVAVDDKGCPVGMELTVSTDKNTYSPGETVIIRGSVWDAKGGLDGATVVVDVDGTKLTATAYSTEKYKGKYECEFLLPPDISPGTHTVTATASYPGYPDKSKTTSFTVGGETKVTLDTDKEYYMVGEEAKIYGYVKVGNQPIGGAEVEITFSYPERKTWKKQVQTNSDGYYECNINIIEENWFQTEPLFINLSTDKNPEYERGEPVTISGEIVPNTLSIKIKASKTGFQTAVNKKRLKVGVEEKPPELKQVFLRISTPWGIELPLLRITPSAGKFSITPFAGYALGEYLIEAKAKYKDIQISSNTKFEVRESAPATQEQIDEVLRLYEWVIPEGFIRSDKGYSSAWCPLMDIKEAEMGFWNNLCYGSNGFHCAGYRDKVLYFLDKLRFSQDPKKRALLRGLDYGPVQRGYGCKSLFGRVVAGSSEHHVVILYHTGTIEPYRADDVLVLDPWLYQRPEVFKIKEFKTQCPEWSQGEVTTCLPDREYRDGGLAYSYPLMGSPVYLNFECKEWSTKRPESPFLGLEKYVVAVACPVNVLITDSEERRLGRLENGSFVFEIPNSQLIILSDDDATPIWFLALPEGVYQTSIKGYKSGPFNLLTRGKDWPVRDYGSQVINKGDEATITLDSSDPSSRLNLPNGEQVYPHQLAGVPATAQVERLYPIHILLFATGGVAGLAAFGLLLFLLVRRRRPAPVAPPVPPPARPVRPRGRPEELVSTRPPARPEGPPERLGGGKPSGPPETLD